MSEKSINLLPIGALKRRNTKDLLLGTHPNDYKVRREVSNEYQLDKRSLNKLRTQDLTGRQQEYDQTNENDLQEESISEGDITEPRKKMPTLQLQAQKEREKSLEKMKVDFSQFLNLQKKTKDQKNGAFDCMLKKYLIDKEAQHNQQHNKIEFNASEANKQFDDEGNEIIQIVEESKEQKNKKRIMDMKIDEAVRLDLGEVKSKKKREVDENLNQKLENSILEDNSISEDVRRIKLSNLHHQMLVERVRSIIQKTKKRNSDGETASNHIFENTMAIFKGLDTFIETKSFWQHLNSAEGKYQSKGIGMKNGAVTARRVSKINELNPSKSSERSPQTSRVLFEENEKELPSVIAKSRKYLDQNIGRLTISEKKIGGQFLKGLEMQFMGEIKQNLNIPTSKKIEESTEQPALKKANNIDSEEEAFFNQLSDQILTGELQRKQRKEMRKYQQGQEEQYNQTSINQLDDDGFRNTAAFEMAEFEEKAKKGGHMLLVKSKNILKEKFHKLDLANHLAKQQRAIEMQQQHLHLKNLWERMSSSQKRSQKLSQSEQEQNQSSAQNSLLQKGDTSSITETNKSFLVSPNLLSKYAADFPSVSSKELPKITSQHSLPANEINQFHKVKQGEPKTPCISSATTNSKIAKEMNKRKPNFSPGNRIKISNSEKCLLPPEIKNSKSPEFMDTQSTNTIQKKNSLSFITQEQSGIHPIMPQIQGKKDKTPEPKTVNLDIYRKTPLKNITPIKHSSNLGKDSLFQSASTSKIELANNKNNRHEIPESIFRSTSRQQMQISSLSPIQSKKRIQDKIGQSPSKKMMIHLNLNKADYSPCNRPSNNLNQNVKNMLPSISSTQQPIQSANKQNQSGRKQFCQEVFNLQDDLLRSISNFKKQYREDKVILAEQIKQIQSEIDSVQSNQNPEQLDSLRM